MNAANLVALCVVCLAVAAIVKAVVAYMVIARLTEAHTEQQLQLSDLLHAAWNRQHPFNRRGIDPAEPLVPFHGAVSDLHQTQSSKG